MKTITSLGTLNFPFIGRRIHINEPIKGEQKSMDATTRAGKREQVAILYFHKSHDTPLLPSKILNNYCLQLKSKGKGPYFNEGNTWQSVQTFYPLPPSMLCFKGIQKLQLHG